MADLRIVDAPEIPTENITGEEKLPTGGSGNYSITLDSVADYTKTKKDLADNTSVDGKVNGVRQELNVHIEDSTNPHQVTKGQIGLGNVDNTADADKPVSNSTQAAIISTVAPKADKTYVDNQLTLKANKTDVYTKSETYTKQESSDLVNNIISTALIPVNSSLDLAKRGVANRYDSSLTYNSGEHVVLANGDIVKSTIDGNANDPNVDMTGWVKVNVASQIFDDNGLSQQEVNNLNSKKLNGQLSIFEVMTQAEYNSYISANYEAFDATEVVQRAIDRAYVEAKEVFVPAMFAIRTASLVLPEYVSFVGQEYGRATTRYKSGFASYVQHMFVPNSNNPTYGTLKRVNVYARNIVFYSKIGATSTCFYNMCLYGSDIYKCFAYNFDIVINGTLMYCTKIYNNIFLGIISHFISVKNLPTQNVNTTPVITDSDVYKNYINGSSKGECIAFDMGSSSYFDIYSNFIDFCYKAFYGRSPSLGSIKNNIFDVCYKGVDIFTASGLNISGNTPSKILQSNAGLFTNLTGSLYETEIRNNPWVWLNIISMQESVIKDNVGGADTLININGYSLANLRTAGNINTNVAGNGIVLNRTLSGSIVRDGQGLHFAELDYRTVATLPTPIATIGGVNRQTYTGDKVTYNGQVLVNDGTDWKSLNGLGILYKQSRTFQVTSVAPNTALKFGPFTITGLKAGAKVEVMKQVDIANTVVSGECIADNQYSIIVYNYGATSTIQNNYTFNVVAQNL